MRGTLDVKCSCDEPGGEQCWNKHGGPDGPYGEDFEPHQPDDGAAEEAAREEEAVAVLTRANATGPVASKGVKTYRPHYEPPDLADYFRDYDLDDDKQITICRAYASYLASLKPKKRRRTTTKK